MRLFRLLTPVVALTLALPATGCLDSSDTTAPVTNFATVEATAFDPALGIDLTAPGWTRSSTGLFYRTLTAAPSTAAIVTAGQSVNVRYTGWLSSGQMFESNTYAFTISNGVVIAGWDQGIVGMRVGEKRRLLIPPTLGYGAIGSGKIPGNAVLVFDVEVLSAT